MGHRLICAVAAASALVLPPAAGPARAAPDPALARLPIGKWVPIFDGKTLKGWVPKINHHPLGENWRNTFRVEDGKLTVNYDQYPSFKDEFGHLIFKTKLSSYRIRLEYRAMGPSPPGAEAWAVRNNGIMIHGQAPEDMALDQPYPMSVEAQILGGTPGAHRPTGNVCSPGTTISIGGVPQKQHCIESSAPTFQDGEWVKFEVEVHGNRLVRQFVNGVKVMEYTDIWTDPSEYRRFGNIDPGDRKPEPLGAGYISLQAESAPFEFRRIELMRLKD
ncbi:MAG: DUF1080 domain-containing protein [Proteobacteria bacterium]|nr:DUF1080 domain-containing protein [Pseudomonadota bacterium]